MDDNIVTRLREEIDSLKVDVQVLREAADEIERLTGWRKNALLALDKREAEIGRLRAAGDALAKQITRPCRCVEAHDGAINETCSACAAFFDWQEARRG